MMTSISEVNDGVRAVSMTTNVSQWNPPAEDRRHGRICTLLLHIQMLLCRSWEVRRDNSVAYYLAKLANPDSTCVIYFEDPPPSIVQILQRDVASISVTHDFFFV
ncbi:hypothetical protein V6N11_010812 [Hibiscus sabdariffa]|uniref:RNase H type-1 domain-containing protein n=1 Tax=Hibiscus sabdariffa TaxID=183260 RepID=A0ABR2S6W9_9ROSI